MVAPVVFVFLSWGCVISSSSGPGAGWWADRGGGWRYPECCCLQLPPLLQQLALRERVSQRGVWMLFVQVQVFILLVCWGALHAAERSVLLRSVHLQMPPASLALWEAHVCVLV